MTQRSRLSSALLCAAIVMYAHSVPTHLRITAKAVEYLKQQDPTFAGLTDTQLQNGVAHEDDIPRYMFHFFPALNTTLFQATCRSVDWGFLLNLSSTCTQTGEPRGPNTLTNDHTWNEAVKGARDPNLMDQGWDHLGYILHLLQDLTSPAHTRNDPHPHFNVLGVDLGNPDLLEALDRTPSLPTGVLVSFNTPEEFFVNLQNFVSSNYFSKDRVFQGNGPPEGIQDAEYFYDARNSNRKIAHKGWRYKLSGATDATRDKRLATISADIADEQWAELGPTAVLHTASLIRHYASIVPTVRMNPSGNKNLPEVSPPFAVESVNSQLSPTPAPRDITVTLLREVISQCRGTIFSSNRTAIITEGQFSGTYDSSVAGADPFCNTLPITTRWTVLQAVMAPSTVLDLGRVPPVQLSLAVTRGSPTCPAATICGDVTDAETGTVALQGIVIELRNSLGSLIRSTRTDSAGNYSFTSLAAGNYFVVPVVLGGQSASPSRIFTSPGSAPANFQIRGVPATVTVSGAPNLTLVLITTAEYTDPLPPPLPAPFPVYEAVSFGGQAVLGVPGGFSYWITCFPPGQPKTTNWQLPRPPDTPGRILKAQESISTTCPP